MDDGLCTMDYGCWGQCWEVVMATVLAMRGRGLEGECTPYVKPNVDSRTSAEELGVLYVNRLYPAEKLEGIKDEHGRLAV